MKAYTYIKKGVFAMTDKPKPTILEPTDAIVRTTQSSICSSDLHIKHGSVPRAVLGITLGHEMVGIVDEIGPEVKNVKVGDRVTVNVETFCGECFFCQHGYVNNCTSPHGGWALGCRIDGGQTEYVRVPLATQGLNRIPDGVSDEQALFVGDVLATGFWAARISDISEDDTVLIIGAGGLGSPAALYLAAAGVGHIGLVDGDVVDMSNLQRQIIHTTARVGAPKVESAATAIRALNPDVTVDTYYELVDASNIAGLIEPYDLVIDATDNFAAKFLINDACVLAGKPYIHAGVVGFAGQVMTVIPGEGPCYRCIFRDLPAAGEIPTCKEAGVLGAVVGVIGSLEATEAVKLIAGVGEPLVARMLTVDALTMNIRRVPLPKHVPDCPVCGEQPTITAIDPANYIQPACAI